MSLIDVIIPSYKSDGVLASCLKSIKAHRPPDTRVIVVDNGNDHPYLESDGVILIPSSENLGFIKATNLGMARSTADILVLQNDDTVIYNDVYTTMLRHLGWYGIVGCVFSPGWQWQAMNNLIEIPQMCKITIKGFEYVHQAVLTQEDHIEIAKRLYENTKVIDAKDGMVNFACAMIRRDVIRKIGYLNESYGVGLGDDADYCRRAVKAGFKVGVALGAYVYHHHRHTFKKLYTEEQLRQMGQAAQEKFDKEG